MRLEGQDSTGLDYSEFRTHWFSPEERSWVLKQIPTIKRTQDIKIYVAYPESYPGALRIVVMAPDWAGLLDIISGKIHQQGYNIHAIAGLVIDRVGVVRLEVWLNSEREKENVQSRLKQFEEFLRVIGKGGGAVKQILSLAIRKLDVFEKIVAHLSSMIDDRKTLEALVSEEGEAVKFVISRSEAYLMERKPEDLARQIFLNYEFQKILREKGRGILVKAENIWSLGGWLTGLSVAGMDRDLSLDDVLDALREYLPSFHREYDKQFISRDGVTVIRLEITDGKGNPLSEEELPLLENWLYRKLDRPRLREPLNIKLSVELFGRLIIPRLIDEVVATGVPQFYLLPGRTGKDEADFKLAVVKPKARDGSVLLTSLVEALSKIEGISVQSSKVPSFSRGCEIEIINLRAELGKFRSEEEIYSRVKDAVRSVIQNFRDFDEGMRTLDRMKLIQTEKILKINRESDKRFVREYFFSMEDFHRLQAPVEHIVSEISLAQDAIQEHQILRGPVLKVKDTNDAILVCLVAPGEPGLYEELFRRMSEFGDMVLTRLDDYGLSMFALLKRKGKPRKAEVTAALKDLMPKLMVKGEQKEVAA